MIFLGRIDESDTHGQEPDMVMAALLGSGDQWRIFGRRVRAIQRQYEFSVFHTVEFRTLTGEFARWDENKCVGFIKDIGAVASGTLTECVTVRCDYATYRDHFLKVRPGKMHQTSQYGFCFMALLDALTLRVGKLRGKNRLSVIVEDGHKNAPDTGRIFEERKKAYMQQAMDFYRSHSLVSKEDDPLLMMSDIAAYGQAQLERAKRSNPSQPPSHNPNARGPRGNETGWTLLEITPAYIENIIEEFKSGQAAKHEEYLKRRAEWLASKTQS